jgi:tungstate transport system ATP-binding protein
MADAPGARLSGGQQQRLALARAWALQPDILFLDEPTASLDPGAKREVEALIEDLGRDGITAGDEHAQPRPGQAPGHPRGLPRGRPAAGRPADRRFFNTPLPPEAASAFLKGELPWH